MYSGEKLTEQRECLWRAVVGCRALCGWDVNGMCISWQRNSFIFPSMTRVFFFLSLTLSFDSCIASLLSFFSLTIAQHANVSFISLEAREKSAFSRTQRMRDFLLFVTFVFIFFRLLLPFAILTIFQRVQIVVCTFLYVCSMGRFFFIHTISDWIDARVAD